MTENASTAFHAADALYDVTTSTELRTFLFVTAIQSCRNYINYGLLINSVYQSTQPHYDWELVLPSTFSEIYFKNQVSDTFTGF